MKLLLVSVCLAVLACVSAITVEDAWKAYKEKSKKADNQSWVKDIPNFETFKSQWDEAKAFNAKHAVAENAWSYYKKLYGVNFPAEEEQWRFELFKESWEEIIKHNEKYALGEVYYPRYSYSSYYHMNEAEKIAYRRRPVE